MERGEGFNYMPKGKPAPVVKPGEFIFAAVGLDHAHIGGMINGLLESGAALKYLYDPDKAKIEIYKRMFPQAQIASCEDEVLSDPEVRLVASACVPSERCALGMRVMDAGKENWF